MKTETSARIQKTTIDRLRKCGFSGESIDDIINKLLNEHDGLSVE